MALDTCHTPSWEGAREGQGDRAGGHGSDGLELGFGALVGFDGLLEGAELPVQFVDLPVLHAVVEQIAGSAHAQDRVGVLDGNPGEDVEALGNQGLDLHQGDFVSVLAQAVEGRAEPGFLQLAAEG